MAIRKALLVGINTYRWSPLRGCANDVMQMKDLLQRYYDYKGDGIRTLLNEEATSVAVKCGLEWLAQGGDDADAVRVFHYSGHGSYLADQNGDEPDGRDECLCPYDHREAGLLTDDVLKDLYDRFPCAGNLSLVMDCCYSGTLQKAAADEVGEVVYRFLPVTTAERERIDIAAARFVKDQRAYVVQQLRQLHVGSMSEDELGEEVGRLMRSFEKARFGDVRVREANVLLAGCRSDQQSADALIDGDYHGAFTYFLAQAVSRCNGLITYGQLAREVGAKLDAGHFWQVPQLECSASRDQLPVFRPF